MRDWAEPETLVGRRLDEVVVGWHRFSGSSTPVTLFLSVEGQWLEVCTTGDGSLRLARTQRPVDFDMAEYGQFKMLPAGQDHPLHPLIGQTLGHVRLVIWEHTCVGLVIEANDGSVVLANEADEIFVSNGALPPDYAGMADPE